MSPPPSPHAPDHEIRSLLRAISHDARAPLRVIDGFARAIEEDYSAALEGAGIDALKRIRAAAGRLDKMLLALADYTELSAHTPEPTRTDLTHRARDMIERLRAAEPSRTVAFHADEAAPVADRKFTDLIVSELIANAWKFTRATRDPAIALRVLAPTPEGAFRFAVEDNGDGFEVPKDREALFGLFRRHDASDPTGGAGLAMAARAATILGGEIHAESSPGRGARFICTLPAAADFSPP